jgi:hypothetical protein
MLVGQQTTDVDRTADSLEAVQIMWVTAVAALAVFIVGIVVARTARRVVHLPNRLVLESPIIDFTAVDWWRSILGVGLDYGTDLARAEEVIRTALHRVPTAGAVANGPVARGFDGTARMTASGAGDWMGPSLTLARLGNTGDLSMGVIPDVVNAEFSLGPVAGFGMYGTAGSGNEANHP